MQGEGHRRGSAAELAERVVRLGRNGLGRTEIAAELGVGLGQLAWMEARRPRLAAALRRAADAERAWWEAQPREALAAGARFNMGAWRAAMGWRFGAQAPVGTGAGAAAGGMASGLGEEGAPARPRTIYLIPDNGMERQWPGGPPLTPEQRRARNVAPVVGEIERLESELGRWHERLREVEAWDVGAGEGDEDGADEDGDWNEEDGWNEEDEIDDEDGDGDDRRSDDGDGDDADGGDERDADARGAGGHDGAGGPRPLAPGESPPPRFTGRGDRPGGADPAGCEWPLSAGLARAPAWAAQPDLRAGGAAPAAGLRDGLR